MNIAGGDVILGEVERKTTQGEKVDRDGSRGKQCCIMEVSRCELVLQFYTEISFLCNFTSSTCHQQNLVYIYVCIYIT